MDIRFDGKVALVSGGAQGIGQSMAVAFRKSGARVHLVDRDARIMEIGRELDMMAHVADLSERAAATQLVRKIADQEGRLDILALAAGGLAGLAGLPLEAITEENWDRILGANVESALHPVAVGSVASHRVYRRAPQVPWQDEGAVSGGTSRLCLRGCL